MGGCAGLGTVAVPVAVEIETGEVVNCTGGTVSSDDCPGIEMTVGVTSVLDSVEQRGQTDAVVVMRRDELGEVSVSDVVIEKAPGMGTDVCGAGDSVQCGQVVIVLVTPIVEGVEVVCKYVEAPDVTVWVTGQVVTVFVVI